MVNSVNTTIIPITSTTPTNGDRQPASGQSVDYPSAGDLHHVDVTDTYTLGLSNRLKDAVAAGKEQAERALEHAKQRNDTSQQLHDNAQHDGRVRERMDRSV